MSDMPIALFSNLRFGSLSREGYHPSIRCGACDAIPKLRGLLAVLSATAGGPDDESIKHAALRLRPK
jgi:hypothetical protein